MLIATRSVAHNISNFGLGIGRTYPCQYIMMVRTCQPSGVNPLSAQPTLALVGKALSRTSVTSSRSRFRVAAPVLPESLPRVNWERLIQPSRTFCARRPQRSFLRASCSCPSEKEEEENDTDDDDDDDAEQSLVK